MRVGWPIWGCVEIDKKWLAKGSTGLDIRWLFVATHLVDIMANIGISHAELRRKVSSGTNALFVQFIFKKIVGKKQQNGAEHDD